MLLPLLLQKHNSGRQLARRVYHDAIAAEVSTFLVQDAGSACKAVARGIQPGAVISRRAKARSGLFSEGWFLAFGGGVHDKPRRAPRPGSME